MSVYSCYEEGLNRVFQKALFREKEVNYLVRLFGPPECMSCQSLFIYGHSSTGKTFVVSELLKEIQVPYAWINCYEAHSPRLLFSALTEKLLQNHKALCGLEGIKSCGSLCDFLNFSKKYLQGVKETTYLVFDNAEVLRDKEPVVLAALLRFQELTKANICTVFISQIIWEKFRLDLGVCPPILLHFSNYSKSELHEILCLDCPPDYSKEFYAAYINVVLNVFFVVTRDLQELRHQALISFSKYCEPVVSDEISAGDVHKLWRNIEPTLKKALHTVYLREISGPRWNSVQSENRNAVEGQSEKSTEVSAVTSYRMTTELPFYSKFLLLAAYLASYNPPKTDHRFFVKNQGRTRRKKPKKKNEVNIHLLGPKPFVLDRLLAIFYAIVEDGVLPSALIFSQISSLVSLQLLACVTPEDQLSSPKYKCLAELDLVRNIGRTVDFDIVGYLNDFT